MGSTIQVLTTAAAAPLAAGPLPLAIAPPPTHVSLYEGDVLDLSSQTSTSLFQNVPWPPSLQAKLKTFICFWPTFATMSKLVIGMPLGMPFSPSPLAWTPST